MILRTRILSEHLLGQKNGERKGITQSGDSPTPLYNFRREFTMNVSKKIKTATGICLAVLMLIVSVWAASATAGPDTSVCKGKFEVTVQNYGTQKAGEAKTYSVLVINKENVPGCMRVELGIYKRSVINSWYGTPQFLMANWDTTRDCSDIINGIDEPNVQTALVELGPNERLTVPFTVIAPSPTSWAGNVNNEYGVFADAHLRCFSGIEGSTGESSHDTAPLQILKGTTVQPTCFDGDKNQDETDTDCGGSCSKCKDGYRCLTASDCITGSSCQDFIQSAGTAQQTTIKVCKAQSTCAIPDGSGPNCDCSITGTSGMKCPAGYICDEDDSWYDACVKGCTPSTSQPYCSTDKIVTTKQTLADCANKFLNTPCTPTQKCEDGKCIEIPPPCADGKCQTCGDGVCANTEQCSCEADCGEALKEICNPACDNDGICDPGEVSPCDSCGGGECDDISGNGQCDVACGENCEANADECGCCAGALGCGPTTCTTDADCPAIQLMCGDPITGKCNIGLDGIGTCDDTVYDNAVATPSDDSCMTCNNNGICDAGEYCGSCPADCGACPPLCTKNSDCIPTGSIFKPSGLTCDETTSQCVLYVPFWEKLKSWQIVVGLIGITALILIGIGSLGKPKRKGKKRKHKK